MDRSTVATSFDIVAGTLLEWKNSSTEAPFVMGSWTSNTMIRAVKEVVRGKGSLGGHKT